MKQQVVVLAILALALLFGVFPGAVTAGTGDTFDLQGFVFEDVDEDGLYTGFDRPLSDVTVRLYQDNEPLGVWGREDAWLRNTQSNGEGLYLFDEVLVGRYLLVEMPPLGFNCTTGCVIGLRVAPHLPLNERELSFGNVYAELYPASPFRLFLPTIIS